MVNYFVAFSSTVSDQIPHSCHQDSRTLVMVTNFQTPLFPCILVLVKLHSQVLLIQHLSRGFELQGGVSQLEKSNTNGGYMWSPKPGVLLTIFRTLHLHGSPVGEYQRSMSEGPLVQQSQGKSSFAFGF